jgi:hypothetical protein
MQDDLVTEYRATAIRLYRKVQEHMKWDEGKTVLWFTTENPNFGGIAPLEMIYKGRAEKLERFINNGIDENFP